MAAGVALQLDPAVPAKGDCAESVWRRLQASPEIRLRMLESEQPGNVGPGMEILRLPNPVY